MSDKTKSTAVIRLTVYDRDDNLTQLERALALAKDLEKAGLEVLLTGDIYITAKVPEVEVER